MRAGRSRALSARARFPRTATSAPTRGLAARRNGAAEHPPAPAARSGPRPRSRSRAAAGSSRRSRGGSRRAGSSGHSKRCIPKYGRRSCSSGGISCSWKQSTRIVPLTRKTSSPPGRSSREASGIQRYGSAQIEAPYSETTRSNDASGQRHVLGARLDERELEAVLRLHRARGLELGRSDVDAGDARALPGEPGRDVRRPAPELDDVLPGHVRQRVHLGLRNLPDAPGDLLLRPGAVGVRRVLRRLRRSRPRGSARACSLSVMPGAPSRSAPSASAAPRPSPRRVAVRRLVAPSGGLHLDQVFDQEARAAEEPDPLAHREHELDRPLRRLPAVHAEVRPLQAVGVRVRLLVEARASSSGVAPLNANRPPWRSTRATSGTNRYGSANVGAPQSAMTMSKESSSSGIASALACSERELDARPPRSPRAPARAAPASCRGRPGGRRRARASATTRRRRSPARARPSPQRRRAPAAPLRESATGPRPGRAR